MSKSTKYALTEKGSVNFHGEDGLVSIKKGEQISASDLKKVPKRQQKYFEAVEVKKSDSEEQEEPSLEEQVADEFTVEQLQEALIEAEVDYASDAKKAALVDLYIEHIHEG